MNFPIDLSFKILAIASQIYIRDAIGNQIGYVKQKLFKLKEDINIYADENRTRIKYNIKADRMLDFSAKYNFTDEHGRSIGAVKRQGLRSIWKANYDVFDAAGNQIFKINEENGWVKVLDGIITEVPVLGMFTGYFLHPAYIVSRPGGAPVARLEKRPAFFEGKFTLSSLGPMSELEETQVLLAF